MDTSTLSPAEQRLLEAEARRVLQYDRGGTEWTGLRGVLDAIDTRRFDDRTKEVRREVHGAVRRAIARRVWAETDKATIEPAHCQGVSTWRCSRNGRHPAPKWAQGGLVFVPSCAQHAKIATEDAIRAGFSAALSSGDIVLTSWRDETETTLDRLVEWAEANGADLSRWADDLKARGVVATVPA